MTETTAPKSRRIAARVAVAAALTLGPAAMLAAPALAATAHAATPIDWDDHGHGGWGHHGDWDHHGHDWDHHGWDHDRDWDHHGGWYAPPTGSF